MSRRKPPARRTAAVVRLYLDKPLQPVRVDVDRYDDVLLVARVGRAVVGQVFVPAKPVLEPAEIWDQLERELGRDLRRAALRALIGRALGAPAESSGAADVSVIVCTRDRPDELRCCLASLRQLRTPAEVVVVDNASSDGAARQVADEFSARYVHEPLPGQSRARNRGINAARGRLLAFTDDDCVVEPDWLEGLASDFADPAVGLVTGCIGPYELETPAQYMFESHGGFERQGMRRVWDPTRLSVAYIASQVGAGANMVFRRRALEDIDGFAEDLGPGTAARSGDDKDAFYRLLAAGHRILYAPERVVWHRHRDTPDALRRVFFDYGVSEFSYSLRNMIRHRDVGATRILLWWLKHFAQEGWTHVHRDPQRLPPQLLLAEIAGAIQAPLALVRTGRERRSIPRVTIAPAAVSASGRVSVAHEPAGGVTMAIATRDRSARLEALLRRLAGQSLPSDRYEVVVIVDGGADDSAARARALELPFELRVVDQEPSGLAVTRNRGAREAKHPIVVFLDDDIAPVDGLLASHLAAHDGARAPRVVLGPYPPAALPPDRWGRRQAAWWNDHFRRKAEPGHVWTFIDYVDGNTSLQPRALEQIGGYDERFRGGRRQDWELGVRLLAAGWEFVNCPAAHGDHHFDARFETALRVSRDEGRQDVMFARIHPSVRDHLPISRIASQLLRRSRPTELARSLAFDRPARWNSALRLLDWTDRVRSWNAIVNRLLSAAYIAGMDDALPDAAERRSFLEWAGSRAGLSPPGAVDLHEPASLAPPLTVAPVELEVRWQTRPLGRHRVLAQSENWSWEEVVERLAISVERSSAKVFRHDWCLHAVDGIRPQRDATP